MITPSRKAIDMNATAPHMAIVSNHMQILFLIGNPLTSSRIALIEARNDKLIQSRKLEYASGYSCAITEVPANI